jgi:hypothetical protein
MAFIHSLFKADSNLSIPFPIFSHDIQYAILMYPFPPVPKASPGTTAALASLNKMVHKNLPNTFFGALPADDLLLYLIGVSTVCEIIPPLSLLKTKPPHARTECMLRRFAMIQGMVNQTGVYLSMQINGPSE